MEAYTSFAQVYDLFQDNIPYGEWADYLKSLLNEYGVKDGLVLDLGCGSGRDSRYLEEAGCYVTPMDGSPKMCSLAEIYTDLEVLCLTFEEMEFQEVFDGIWASASLLHVASKDMPRILKKVYDALKPGGVAYMSFQYGEGEEYRNGRFFCDYTEKTMKKLLQAESDFEILDIYQSDDVREGRPRWLNVLVKKEGGEEDD